jgi:hypothetical protein
VIRRRGSARTAADQPIEAKALIERSQVLVDAERKAHTLDPPLRCRPLARLGAEQHPVGCKLGDANDDRLLAGVQQSTE